MTDKVKQFEDIISQIDFSLPENKNIIDSIEKKLNDRIIRDLTMENNSLRSEIDECNKQLGEASKLRNTGDLIVFGNKKLKNKKKLKKKKSSKSKKYNKGQKYKKDKKYKKGKKSKRR